MATDPRIAVLEELRAQTQLLRQILAALKPAVAPSSVNIDGPHGNPIVKAKDPKDWTGESMKGRTFSECPPEYLEMIAERLDYFASRETDAQNQKYNLLDAQRARAWAARLRAGWQAPTPAPIEGEPTW